MSIAETRVFDAERIQRLREKYPGKLPVVVSKASECNLPNLDRTRFLIPYFFTIQELVMVVRSRLRIKPEETILLFVDHKGSHIMVPMNYAICNIYDLYKDKDEILQVLYASENVFGCGCKAVAANRSEERRVG